MALSMPSTLQLEEVTKAVKEYQDLGRILSALRADPSACSGYTLVRRASLYRD